MWAALASGPIGLAVACASPAAVTPTAQAAPPPSADVRIGDPSGLAVLFCDLWLRSDAGAADSSTAQAVHRLAPDVELPKRLGTATPAVPQDAVAIRSSRVGQGRWSVVIAVRLTVRDGASPHTPGGAGTGAVVRYYAVPVSSAERAGGSGAFTVTAAPSQIADPAAAKISTSPFTQTLPADGPLSNSLADFFRAYLVSVGDVERYLSPGTRLTAVAGTDYKRIAVDEVSATSEAAVGPVPADGTTSRVRVRVTATDSASTRWPLVYELTVTARSGRWDVTALHAGATHTAASSHAPTAGGTAR
ncbi:conjugal transfer protein [Streptomyces sp. NPDC051098]|uniref:conjugal transfer protein n=1 Tax=Streptomyces sp. NPDC051098 TaxID=3155411 RepID=UPI00342F8E79